MIFIWIDSNHLWSNNLWSTLIIHKILKTMSIESNETIERYYINKTHLLILFYWVIHLYLIDTLWTRIYLNYKSQARFHILWFVSVVCIYLTSYDFVELVSSILNFLHLFHKLWFEHVTICYLFQEYCSHWFIAFLISISWI